MVMVRRKYLALLAVFLVFLTIQFLLPLSFHPSFPRNSLLPRRSKAKTSREESIILKKYPHFRSQNGHSKVNLTAANFTLNCDITSKDAIFAINRAKSYKCKKELADVACLAQEAKLYPAKLPQLCPMRVKLEDSVTPVHKSELQPVRIAFLFVLNGRASRQVTRLIAKIYSQQHFYFIHVDKRQDYLFNELLFLEKLPNIKLTRNRLSTIWGGASLLQMLFNSLKELLQIPDWDYVINLSESDFPIKPLKELEEFLSAKKGRNFVKFTGQEPKIFLVKQGLDRTFYECDDHMWMLGYRKLPDGIVVNGGSDWIALTRDFCTYATESGDDLVKGLRDLYKYTLLPAESFFHTLLRNSRFCDTMVDNNLRFINWRRKQGCKCQYKHVVDWCGCSPNDFKIEDWPRILTALNKPLYFARKFEPSVSQLVINKIDLVTRGKTKPSQQNFERYWQNDYHCRFDSQDDFKRGFYTILSFMALERVHSLCGKENKLLLSGIYSNRTSPEEATLFFENDTYQGTLIKFAGSFSGDDSAFSLEFFARPINYFQTHENDEDLRVSAKVCSDYDVKEQMFRNFGCVLNPFSEVAVEHTWSSSFYTNITATFVWIDPIENLAGSFQVKVNLGHSWRGEKITLLHKPSFELPLRPGVWKLKIFYNWKLVSESRFLIAPFIFHRGEFLSSREAAAFHSGPLSEKYLDYDFSNIERFLKLRQDPHTLDNFGETDSMKTGMELLRWAARLTADFWAILDFCSLSGNPLCQSFEVIPCKNTPWSPFSPDLKANFLI